MKIAFASCAKIQDFPEQPAWKSIEDDNPDLLLLLGDNVYAPNKGWDLGELDKRYQEQFQESNFASLTSKVPFKAIWDDHDFGPDNSKGAEVSQELKDGSRELFHKYMKSSTNLPEAYYSFSINDVHFIMLDVRYYREDSNKDGANPLGKKQLVWLKNELQKPSKFKILCSGTCLTKVIGFQNEYLAKYKNFYKDEFLPLLQEVNKLIVLTGDIHRNFIKEHDGFFEIISSAVGRGSVVSKKNRNNYGLLEFKDSVVEITLKDRRDKDRFAESIDISTWKLEE